VQIIGKNLEHQIDLDSLFDSSDLAKQTSELHKILLIAGIKP
jgi:hypothetical protein